MIGGAIAGGDALINVLRDWFGSSNGGGATPAAVPAGPNTNRPTPVVANRGALASSERQEIANRVAQAEQSYDDLQQAELSHSPLVPALRTETIRVAEKLIQDVARMIGLPAHLAQRIGYDIELDVPGVTRLATNRAFIGPAAIGKGGPEMLVATIIHEAVHLHQRDRDKLSSAAYDAQRAAYEAEATRISEDYMRKLGYSEEVIRNVRRYAVDVH